ncbi:MAG: hypothetical protein ACREMA_11790, partial [Longimicrobiales bacterium]
LLTGPMFAFNIDRLAVRTQIPRNIVAACARRLFDNGVWQPDGPIYTWRAPDDAQFWNDVGVAEGKLCRRVDRLGRIEWASAGAWRKAYEAADEKGESLTILYSTHAVAEPEESSPSPAAERAGLDDVRLPLRPRVERGPKSASRAVRVVSDTGAVTSGAPWRSDLFPGANWLS